MKVLATFDGSKCSEAILPQLEWMADLPNTQFTFLSIAHRAHEPGPGRTLQSAAGRRGLTAGPIAIPAADPALVEDRGEAIERTLAERSDYLQGIVSQMPPGPKYRVEATIADDVSAAIIRYAIEHQPDLIVMGTHGETSMIHRLFGDTAEAVVRSGVAPVLLVHSNRSRQAAKNYFGATTGI
jgi:nucleotide-binding universal stress UspA family protein